MGDLMESIMNRRSIRKYTDQAVPDQVKEILLNAAKWAPAGGNRQTWCMGIVDDPKQIWRIESVSPGLPKGAPVILAVCSNVASAAAGGNTPYLCTVNAALAAENLQLCAHDLGLGTCMVASFHRGAVSSLLKLPETVTLEFLITLGYPAPGDKPLTVPPRCKTEEIFFKNVWDKD